MLLACIFFSLHIQRKRWDASGGMQCSLERMRDFEKFVLHKHRLRVVVTASTLSFFRGQHPVCAFDLRRGSAIRMRESPHDSHDSLDQYASLARFHLTQSDATRVVHYKRGQCRRQRCFDDMMRAFPAEWADFCDGDRSFSPPRQSTATILLVEPVGRRSHESHVVATEEVVDAGPARGNNAAAVLPGHDSSWPSHDAWRLKEGLVRALMLSEVLARLH